MAFPVYDEDARRQIEDILEIQRRDNTHARMIDSRQQNKYRTRDGAARRAQTEIYRYCEALLGQRETVGAD